MIDPSNYTMGLPIAASTYASKVDKALDIVHLAMVVIFVLWGLFFVVTLFKFRRGAKPKANYEASKGGLTSFLPDVAVLLFEIWLIFVVGLPIYAEMKEIMPPSAQSTEIDMVAEQYAWTFQYAGPDGILGERSPQRMNATNQLGIDRTHPAAKDDIVSINELYAPLGKPVIIYMTSKDVIHSFFVPEFRVKQDVVPGMRIPLWFEALKTGRYEIGCAQLCGLGHYRMRGEVVIVTPEEYAAWQETQQKELAEQAS